MNNNRNDNPGQKLSHLVDSHAHIDMCGDPETEIGDARDRGVERILAVGFDLETSRKAVQIAERYDGVGAAVGVHPHDAAIVDDAMFAEIEDLASSPAVIAIGETGLDYYRDRSPRKAQRESFLRHMELARKAGLTLMVHSREAADDCLHLLEAAQDLKVVLHCFSLYPHLDYCIERGYFMSIAGNVTYPKATELQRAAAAIPAKLLLTETDSPWLSPVPHRGKPNRPANIVFILEELARLRQTPPRELAKQVFANFQAAFPGH